MMQPQRQNNQTAKEAQNKSVRMVTRNVVIKSNKTWIIKPSQLLKESSKGHLCSLRLRYNRVDKMLSDSTGTNTTINVAQLKGGLADGKHFDM